MKKVEIIPINCGLANVFILVGEKVIIVDAGLRGSTERILKKLAEQKIQPADISLIFLTHAHPDHCLNTKHLKDTLKVPVAINAKEATYIEKGEFAPVVPTSKAGELIFLSLKSLHEKHDDWVQPEITFEDELDFKPYGVDAVARCTPGHTYGASSIFFSDGRCIVGDLLIGSPVLKKPSLSPFAVDLPLLKSNLKQLLAREDITRIYSSHHDLPWDKGMLLKNVVPKL